MAVEDMSSDLATASEACPLLRLLFLVRPLRNRGDETAPTVFILADLD